MIDEQSSASEHDYASDRSAIGDGFEGGGGLYIEIREVKKFQCRKTPTRDICKSNTIFDNHLFI